MLIRPYKQTDVAAILDSWENASRLAHPFLERAFLDQERKNIPELYLPNAETWVAEVDGSVIGFIALLGDEIGGLFVQPSHHKNGVGRALVDKARTGIDTLYVEVFDKNTIGSAFYTRYGFTPMEEKYHEPTRQTLIRMSHTASAPLIPSEHAKPLL